MGQKLLTPYDKFNERRKRFFFGPKHVVTPALGAIAAAAQGIKDAVKLRDAENPEGMDGSNYASKSHIAIIMADTIFSELDKMQVAENNRIIESEKGEKQ